jgi:Ca2+-binding RTX toxin-like protein
MSTLNAAELAAFSVDAYDAADDLTRRLPPGFVRLTALEGETGFAGLRAAAYLNQATGELVIAYSGSYELRELFTNLSAVTGGGETHLNKALEFAAQARAYAEDLTGGPLADGSITLTGHGVGGGFAALVGVATGLSATTFNGMRIGGLMSALEERFGARAPDYASRIVNYVDSTALQYTLPRGAAQIGAEVDVGTSALSRSGQLDTGLAGGAIGSAVLDTLYDWLASSDEDRHRAQRMLAALQLQYGAVDLVDGAGQALAEGAADTAAHDAQRIEQLNKLMQTEQAQIVATLAFDRLMIDGSSGGLAQDAGGYGDSDDLIVGATGADVLSGGAGDDTLFGGDGNDVLRGDTGDDNLIGDGGSDLYRLDGQGGSDTIHDLSGTNRIVWDGTPTANFYFAQAPGRWTSADGRAEFVEANGATVLRHADGGQVALASFAERDFGVRRFGALTDPITSTSRVGDTTPGWDSDYLEGTGANDRIEGGFGADYLVGYGGDDYLSGGVGTDMLYGDSNGAVGRDTMLGGAGADILSGDAGADRLFGDDAVAIDAAIAGASAVVRDERGDWLNTGEGDDVAVGSDAHDVLMGGGGADLLVGGAGNDHLLGDVDYMPEEYDWTFVGYANGSTDHGDLASAPSGDGDLLYGGAGNDWILGGRGDDAAFGGTGADTLIGDVGADTLNGEEGGDALWGGLARRGDYSDLGDDYLDGGAGDDVLYGSGGRNFLLGGDGADTVYTGPSEDLVEAGAGDDRISGQGGDTVYAGDGNDVFTAFGTAGVAVYGEGGSDSLSGEQGDDWLAAGDGDDVLWGHDGADVLDGGAGNDRYRFTVGDGIDEIVDAEGVDVVELLSYEGSGAGSEAIDRASIRLVADNSEVYLAYGDQGDRIRLGADPRGLIDRIEVRHIGNGTQWIETIPLADLRVEYAGSADAEILFATAGFRNLLTGGGGNDVVLGSELDDELVGGAGGDVLRGGDGSDRYVVSVGDGVDTIEDEGTSGTDVLRVEVASDVATLGLGGGGLLLDLGGGDAVQIHGFDPLDAAASTTIERIDFADGAVSYQDLLGRGFDLQGSDGADVITGTNLVDRFDGRRGDDRMLGGKGNDEYRFGLGSGHDVVVDQDRTAGNVDRVVFTDGIGATDIEVQADADRLTLKIRGTEDRLDIRWIPDEGVQVEEIQFADGERWDRAALEGKFAPSNVPPGLQRPIADRMVREDQLFTFTLPADTFVDPNPADALALSATQADGSALPGWLTFDAATGTFSGTPSNADVGTISVTVTAADPGGARTADTFDLVVANTNDAPELVAPVGAHAVLEDAPFQFDVPASTFRDVDAGDAIRYFATLDTGAALPGWLALDGATGRFSGTPGNDAVGTHRIRLFAADRAQAMAEDVFDLVVENLNDAPTLGAPLADWTIREAHPLEFQLPGDAFADADAGDSLSFDATLADGSPLPAWLEFDRGTGTFRGVPGRADVGTHAIRVEARDESGATVTDEFVISVEAVPGQVLTGTSGNDTLVGGAGDDTLAGRQGADVLQGGAGDDALLFARDAVWSGNLRRINVGSPGYAGTGETASLSGRNRSFDLFDGGGGRDALIGTAQGDAVLLDDPWSILAPGSPRLAGVEVIRVGDGADLVDLTSTRFAYGGVLIEAGAGSDIVWSSGGDDLVSGGAGNDRIFAGAGDDYVSGDGGSDDLNGASGNDVVQGDGANDKMLDYAGNNLLDGRGGNDDLYDGAGNALLAGGRGADRITLGGGRDIVAFNRGDGRDTVRGVGTAVLSLGGGIEYRDLALRRSGADLLVEVGGGERITLKDWYADPQHRTVDTLQVVAETMQAPAPAASGALFAEKVQWFDFSAIVAAFDEARASTANLGRWQMMDRLVAAHLGGSSSEALGGDLAYQYGLNGAFTGIGLGAAQDVLGAGGFGTDRQGLRPLAELTRDDTKLA